MAEFIENAVQRVEPGQNIILETAIGCNKGYVYHRNQSGVVILRGIVNNPTSCFARYQVTFNGNAAIPSDGVVAPLAIAIAIDGEPVLTSRAIFTPAAVATDPPTTENFGNLTSTAIITVPKGCCFSVAVENVSATPVGGAAPAILIQNANLTVTRIS